MSMSRRERLASKTKTKAKKASGDEIGLDSQPPEPEEGSGAPEGHNVQALGTGPTPADVEDEGGGFLDRWSPGQSTPPEPMTLTPKPPPRRRVNPHDYQRDVFMGTVVAMAAKHCGQVPTSKFMRLSLDLDLDTWLVREKELQDEEARAGIRPAGKVHLKDILVPALSWRYDPDGPFDPRIYAVLAAIARSRRMQLGAAGKLNPRGRGVDIPAQAYLALDALKLKLQKSKVNLSHQALAEGLVVGYAAENKSDQNDIDLDLDTIRELVQRVRES